MEDLRRSDSGYDESSPWVREGVETSHTTREFPGKGHPCTGPFLLPVPQVEGGIPVDRLSSREDTVGLPSLLSDTGSPWYFL